MFRCVLQLLETLRARDTSSAMMKRRIFLAMLGAVTAHRGVAGEGGFTFPSIDGGTLALEDWRGRPVLVANTASLCGFTPQYDGLQALYDSYRDRGLVVLAVPSDDFAQELASADAVKHFCEVNFGLDLPMADISRVKGNGAHPFYRWLAENHGFVPRWNFNKVLLGPDGEYVAHWGSMVRPEDRRITSQIEALLPR